jgi:hypothetical protein
MGGVYAIYSERRELEERERKKREAEERAAAENAAAAARAKAAAENAAARAKAEARAKAAENAAARANAQNTARAKAAAEALAAAKAAAAQRRRLNTGYFKGHTEEDAIKSCFRRLALRMHPNKIHGQNKKNAATAEFVEMKRQCNEAIRDAKILKTQTPPHPQ